MKRAIEIGALILLALVLLAVVGGKEGRAIAVGVGLGMAASIPASIVILTILAKRDEVSEQEQIIIVYQTRTELFPPLQFPPLQDKED